MLDTYNIFFELNIKLASITLICLLKQKQLNI